MKIFKNVLGVIMIFSIFIGGYFYAFKEGGWLEVTGLTIAITISIGLLLLIRWLLK